MELLISLTVWLTLRAGFVTGGISCLSNPCLNGICIDDVNSTYSCYCVDGFTGVQCQTNWDECWSDPCQNGGSCIDGVADFNCSCLDGFIGDNCEINYNECESNPCSNNGTCIDLDNGYVCSCMPGYSGSHCEDDIAVCNSTEEIRCYNGGQCIEGPGFKFYCKCLPGWTGAKCDVAIDECASNPCLNGGVCIDIHADYMCACTFGYTGKSCEVAIEFCDDNSCSNNALCVVEDGVKVCYCVPDYHGDKCELQYDECLLGPRCLNGGSCIDGVDNFTCSCPSGLTGLLCECLILDDGSLECGYVSPTPEPGLSKTTLTSFISDITTNEYTSTIYTTIEGVNTFNTSDTVDLNKFTDIQTSSESASTITELTSIITEEAKTSEVTEKGSLLTTLETTLHTQENLSSEDFSETTTEYESTIEDITIGITTQFTIIDTEPRSESSDLTKEIPIITTVNDIVTETEGSTELDTTTQNIFTDSPTELQTEQSIVNSSSSYQITDVIESTSSEPVTDLYSTVASECSDAVCHDHGICTNTLQGVRCLCRFNYAGRYCENKINVKAAAFGGNSYLSHKLGNDTSISIAFIAKTLISNGQIMHVDIAKGVYMQLYMTGGLLKFKFSCGYQTMLLSELKTFVNKGYPMKIETRLDLDNPKQHCNATLRLNDTVAMSGGQLANFSYLHQNTTLFLGNGPNGKEMENSPFVGCIKDLVVNNIKREVFGEAFDGTEVSECSSLSCLSGPCFNGGSCQDYHDNYTCSCANGWTGDHCEISVCDYNPCQFGGSCVRHPGSGFLCLCPFGKHGIFCEYNVEITRPSFGHIPGGISSFLKYYLPQTVNSERFDLRFRFQTNDMDQIALLAFMGQNGVHNFRSQHLAVTFVKGYIMLTWNLGNGARRIFTPRALGLRRSGHWVRVGRRGRTAWLSVDGNFNVSGNAPGIETKMTVLPYLYIGGHPSIDFDELPHDLPLHSGWRGCLWEVGGGNSGMTKAVSARGVGQCGVAHCTAKSCNSPQGVCVHHPATYGCICNEGWFGATCTMNVNPCDRRHTNCRGRCIVSSSPEPVCDCPYGWTGSNCDTELYPTDVLFTGIRSFVRLLPRPLSSISLSLEMEIKPGKARGLILFTETPHFYTALSLQGALLEYRWTDRVSGVSSVVGSGVVLSIGVWHTARAGRYGSRLYVWVDGTLAAWAMTAHAEPHTTDNASIFLGGADDLSMLPFDVMSGPPESYAGCIRNLHLNNILIPLEKQNIEAGINLKDCDGTPCGSETCGGGTCVVEDGTARCSCGTGTGTPGTRCRRHAPCTPSTCRVPRGRCRRGKCVCSAGYYGDECEKRIDVTIPQFDGEALLQLDVKSHLKGEQRLEKSNKMPDYITMNFTTPIPHGLIIWILMDSDHIGVGLEDGILKLVRSFKQRKRDELTPTKDNHVVIKPLNSAGMVADAEWHVMVITNTDKNITVTVDGIIAYTECLGIDDIKYDEVEIFVGGISEKNKPISKRYFKQNFEGCISDIAIAENKYVCNYTEVYSENIKSCQLYP